MEGDILLSDDPKTSEGTYEGYCEDDTEQEFRNILNQKKIKKNLRVIFSTGNAPIIHTFSTRRA